MAHWLFRFGFEPNMTITINASYSTSTPLPTRGCVKFAAPHVQRRRLHYPTCSPPPDVPAALGTSVLNITRRVPSTTRGTTPGGTPARYSNVVRRTCCHRSTCAGWTTSCENKCGYTCVELCDVGGRSPLRGHLVNRLVRKQFRSQFVSNFVTKIASSKWGNVHSLTPINKCLCWFQHCHQKTQNACKELLR